MPEDLTLDFEPESSLTIVCGVAVLTTRQTEGQGSADRCAFYLVLAKTPRGFAQQANSKERVKDPFRLLLSAFQRVSGFPYATHDAHSAYIYPATGL
jgi:hypothetical protein